MFENVSMNEEFLKSSIMNGGWVAIMMGMLIIFVILALCIYVYMGFAFMAIAKRLKLKAPGLAWIPFVGPMIIIFQSSKMHWWPWLLLIGWMIPFVGWIAEIAFCVFSVMWSWKMFERLKKPGWWAIICLIPIVNFVLYGIAAWGKK